MIIRIKKAKELSSDNSSAETESDSSTIAVIQETTVLEVITVNQLLILLKSIAVLPVGFDRFAAETIMLKSPIAMMIGKQQQIVIPTIESM